MRGLLAVLSVLFLVFGPGDGYAHSNPLSDESPALAEHADGLRHAGANSPGDAGGTDCSHYGSDCPEHRADSAIQAAAPVHPKPSKSSFAPAVLDSAPDALRPPPDGARISEQFTLRSRPGAEIILATSRRLI